MKAADVLDAIHRHHRGAAIVHELVLNDPNWLDTWQKGAEFGSFRRIDALMVKGQQRTAIEVKVSRADFFRETPRKRLVWEKVTHRFVYAVPAGLVRKDEVPKGCGLWEVAPDGSVKAVVRARLNQAPDPLPDQLFVALCYRAMAVARRSGGEGNT